MSIFNCCCPVSSQYADTNFDTLEIINTHKEPCKVCEMIRPTLYSKVTNQSDGKTYALCSEECMKKYFVVKK